MLLDYALMFIAVMCMNGNLFDGSHFVFRHHFYSFGIYFVFVHCLCLIIFSDAIFECQHRINGCLKRRDRGCCLFLNHNFQRSWFVVQTNTEPFSFPFRLQIGSTSLKHGSSHAFFVSIFFDVVIYVQNSIN